MADEIKSRNLTQKEFDRFNSTFELDLAAYFNEMQDQVQKLLDQAVKEGWTDTKLLEEVEKLI